MQKIIQIYSNHVAVFQKRRIAYPSACRQASSHFSPQTRSDETTYKKFYDWCQGNFVTRKNEHQRFKTAVSELQSKLQAPLGWSSAAVLGARLAL